MPELPEVHTTSTGLNKKTKGLIIKDVWTNYNSPFHVGKDNIKNPEFFKKFKKLVVGKKIVDVSRRAKNVLIHLSNNYTILIHMKMTGHIMYGSYKLDSLIEKDPWVPANPKKDIALADPFNRYIRFVISFSNGKQAVLSDMRKFAKVLLIETDKLAASPDLRELGPEPLSEKFDLKTFGERIQMRPTGKIKSVLMDQHLIAGIGNIYSDEILWRAGVHPEKRVEKIDEASIKKMFTATKETLKKGIDFGGDSMSDYRNIDGERGKFQAKHEAYRRTGKSCRKKGCSGIILRKVIGGRSAHYCSVHQK